ncbi:GPP34 family phosphoprotein [Aeromicrobium sp. CF4.19]|uniref:GOLPH3/VPS74 family protein n=1 Tax=Aeromicrobium sp. CF4.19 TaxID=3373082 RepID=UPI003EE53164
MTPADGSPNVGAMNLAEDLLLVALDPSSGKVRIQSTRTDPVLGGAALVQLVHLGRVGVEGAGRKARVLTIDPTPVSDPGLEAAFGRIRQRGRQAPREAVGRLGKGYRPGVLSALVQQGVLSHRDAKVLGIAVQRFELLDAARRDGLVARLRAVLLQDQPADEDTGPLVGLLLAANLLGLVVERPDHRQAKARAAIVAEGDWAADGVRQAVAAGQAAITAAMASGAAAGAA